MERDWDVADNNPDTAIEADHQESMRRMNEHVVERERIRTQEYFDPPEMSVDLVRERFGYYQNWQPNEWRSLIALWKANRVVYVCHNCGSFGYKMGRTNPLFKCYGCQSRNVSVLRAGEISMLVRNSNMGINMEDVYHERREEQRRRRQGAPRIA